MDISILDLILFNVTSYFFGIATGLIICCKNKDLIMKSRSNDNLKTMAMNQPPPPVWDSPVIASAPPPHNPVKLTIE